MLAHRAGRFDLVALCLNYESLTETGIDVDHRIGLLRASIELARRHGADEAAARGYTNLSEMLYRYARLAELEEALGDGLAFTDEHGFPSHAYNLHVHRCLLALRRGDWADAESGLEALVDQDDDPGMLAGHSRPPYGRLLARRGGRGCRAAAGAGLGAGAAPAVAALPGLRRAPPSSSTPGSPTARTVPRPSSRAGPGTRPGRPPSRCTPSCCATPPAPGCRPSRSPAAPSRGRPGCAATGGPRRPGGSRSATRTSRRWSWPVPASPGRPWRRCACSRTSARTPPCGTCGSGCGSWGSRASPAVPPRTRARTRPA